MFLLYFLKYSPNTTDVSNNMKYAETYKAYVSFQQLIEI